MNKVYSRINWENEPSTKTPLNEHNLNKIDFAVDEIDNRVIELDATKAKNTDLQTLSTRVDNLILNAGDSSAECTDARVTEDGTTYDTLKKRLDAEHSSVIEDISQLSNDIANVYPQWTNFIEVSKNTLDVSNLTSDMYIDNANGKLKEYVGWKVTDFIPIIPNTEYIVWYLYNNVFGKMSDVYYACYDGNKVYTHGGITRDTSSTGIATTEKDKYIRISMANWAFNISKYYTMFGLKADMETITKVEDYIPYSLSLKSDKNNVAEEFYSISERLRMTVPSYYENHIASKIAEIRSNMGEVGRNGDTFIFITDLHWESNTQNSPQLVKAIFDSTTANKIICGGDLINQGEKALMLDTMTDCVKAFDFGNPFYCLNGNHDSNKTNQESMEDRWISYNEIYSITQKSSEEKVTYLREDTFDFYFKNDACKMFYICLDTGYGNSLFNPSRLGAIANLLKTVANGYTVVILAHALFDGTSFESGSITKSGTILFDIVDSYNEKGVYTNSEYNLTFDFTEANGECACIISGHMHLDYDTTTPKGIPVIFTDCDSNRTDSTSYKRGTITEQCFDVVTVDTANKKVKCARIGRGNSREFSY